MKEITCFNLNLYLHLSAFSISGFFLKTRDRCHKWPSLSGTVTDAAEGAPIPYAYVVIHAGGGEKDKTIKANSRGKFVFSLDPGLYDVACIFVLVAAAGFVPTCRKLQYEQRPLRLITKLKPDEEHLQPSRK